MTSTDSILSSLQLENSWPRDLFPETEENFQKSIRLEALSEDTDNRSKRPVFNGHYVLVEPTGLKAPKRVLISKDVAYNLLKLTPEQFESDDFLQWVSGNLSLEETWATPYALSIMGERYKNNCPYKTGDGYGDGRAVSIAELNGYELQLKGAGKTPFHRGADGRAVLRSSVREFLASEAMHYLGVKTTRALSLVRSQQDRTERPWYSDDAVLQIPKMDDVRLSLYAEDQRKKIIQQLRTSQKADPNIMISESCAITCRVSSSFVRIGHLDLFARRLQQTRSNTDGSYDTTTREWKELEAMIWHACKREYRKEAYDPFIATKDLAGAASKLLEHSAGRLATMVANWVRVGFAQGNFNADNCLIGGITMDYGPFGWMEEYTPFFAKWTGSGKHYGFLNQPSAGFANYQVLVESVVLVIAALRKTAPDELVREFMTQAEKVFDDEINSVFRLKLGLQRDADAGDKLWKALKDDLFPKSRTDWTLFWRQLTYVMKEFSALESEDYDGMMQILEGNPGSTSCPFYEPLSAEIRRQWIGWLKDWRGVLKASQPSSGMAVFEVMKVANPKYVLREWMLVDAYSTADAGDNTILNELYDLIQRPYEEGSAEEAAAYYRRAPDSAVARGGTAFMS
ncbi:MAG: hypothetical protein SGBAC_000850 [Bacillariaceae sp.]